MRLGSTSTARNHSRAKFSAVSFMKNLFRYDELASLRIGLLEMYNAMPSADWGVNFWIPNEIKITTITHRRMPSSQYEP